MQEWLAVASRGQMPVLTMIHKIKSRPKSQDKIFKRIAPDGLTTAMAGPIGSEGRQNQMSTRTQSLSEQLAITLTLRL